MERITLFDLREETKSQENFVLESNFPTNSLQLRLQFNNIYIDVSSKYIVLKNKLDEEVYICSIDSIFKSQNSTGIAYYFSCKECVSKIKEKALIYKLTC